MLNMLRKSLSGDKSVENIKSRSDGREEMEYTGDRQYQHKGKDTDQVIPVIATK